MAPTWNPDLYMRFERERTRAAQDLLAHTPLATANSVFDLGCGPGNSSELLRRRFPMAEIVGIDASAEMLSHARLRNPGAAFLQEDIECWEPGRPADLIFANAALHFLPNHQVLFPRLISFLAINGCLAVQMPNLLQEATHAAMRLVAADGPWARRLVPIAKTRPVIASFEDYYNWLNPFSAHIDIWMTTYVHVLNGPDEIVDWFAGSALRPFLDPLDESEREQFLARYRDELAAAYPTRNDGKSFLTYPRLFLVAVRK